MRKTILIPLTLALLPATGLVGQEIYNQQSCITIALENNHTLKKSHLDLEKSYIARQELIGSLLPQISGSGSMSYSIQKSRFVMPNFINSMLPPAAQDPTAPEYMTIEMGMNYTAGLGATLNQQIVNFSLFNALDIAETAESLASYGVDLSEEDVIAQVATIYNSIQVLEYAQGQLGNSYELISQMLSTMESSYNNGLVRSVDVDRLKVTATNISTQQNALSNTANIQKNLLKLQMGMDMESEIIIEPLDILYFEQQLATPQTLQLDLGENTSYKLIKTKQTLTGLQKKSVQYEGLPVLSLGLNYNYNFVSKEFFTGDNFYKYPTSSVGLNLRVPIFSGLSRQQKVKQADIELLKSEQDEQILAKSITMGYNNALMKLDNSRRTILAQEENKELAQDVYSITVSNFDNGLATMTDVLNASSSLIQAQINYADALNSYMSAYIELLKTNGTIKSLIPNN